MQFDSPGIGGSAIIVLGAGVVRSADAPFLLGTRVRVNDKLDI